LFFLLPSLSFFLPHPFCVSSVGQSVSQSVNQSVHTFACFDVLFFSLKDPSGLGSMKIQRGGSWDFCQGLLLQCFSKNIEPGSFFSILWDRWTGNHPQEDLAEFANRSLRKVDFLGNPTIFWRHARIYGLAISTFLPLKIWWLSTIFAQNTFVAFTAPFFLSPSGEILPKEKNAAQNPYIPSGNSRYIPKGQLLQAVRRHLYKPQIIATPPS
jgi:hypothetical protein